MLLKEVDELASSSNGEPKCLLEALATLNRDLSKGRIRLSGRLHENFISLQLRFLMKVIFWRLREMNS